MKKLLLLSYCWIKAKLALILTVSITLVKQTRLTRYMDGRGTFAFNFGQKLENLLGINPRIAAAVFVRSIAD